MAEDGQDRQIAEPSLSLMHGAHSARCGTGAPVFPVLCCVSIDKTGSMY